MEPHLISDVPATIPILAPVEPPTKKNLAFGSVCLLCGTDADDEMELGEKILCDGEAVHYLCVLTACNLYQRGEDNQDIKGFLMNDIRNEVKQGAKRFCEFCKKKGSSVGCMDRSCKKVFHYPCGHSSGALTRFFKKYSSWCPAHSPWQTVDLEDPEASCEICFDSLSEGKLFQTTCCQRITHHNCIRQYAYHAGSYRLRCPFCINEKKFKEAILNFSNVFVPIREATYEDNDRMGMELNCIAAGCPDPGRCEASEYWCLIKCSLCGSNAMHKGCVAKLGIKKFECPGCGSGKHKLWYDRYRVPVRIRGVKGGAFLFHLNNLTRFASTIKIQPINSSQPCAQPPASLNDFQECYSQVSKICDTDTSAPDSTDSEQQSMDPMDIILPPRSQRAAAKSASSKLAEQGSDDSSIEDKLTTTGRRSQRTPKKRISFETDQRDDSKVPKRSASFRRPSRNTESQITPRKDTGTLSPRSSLRKKALTASYIEFSSNDSDLDSPSTPTRSCLKRNRSPRKSSGDDLSSVSSKKARVYFGEDIISDVKLVPHVPGTVSLAEVIRQEEEEKRLQEEAALKHISTKKGNQPLRKNSRRKESSDECVKDNESQQSHATSIELESAQRQISDETAHSPDSEGSGSIEESSTRLLPGKEGPASPDSPDLVECNHSPTRAAAACARQLISEQSSPVF